ncbi:MAG TPA: hypothetical protein VFE07_06165 [Marmoricola sp.]|jgi:hypothetical protein|nr:hypothetical protein [Marmoricola sp.]
MGRVLGKAVLSVGRFAALGLLLAVTIAGPLAAGPASAADPTPSPPGSTPSVSPPSQAQIDDARAALDRLRKQGQSRPTQLTQVAGPTEPGHRWAVSRVSDGAWWTLGAGLLVLVVASETTRLSVRRAKHRKQA